MKTKSKALKTAKRSDHKRSYESKLETLRRKTIRTEKYRKTEVAL